MDKKKVLVIDDDETVLDILKDSLAILGYSVEVANNEQSFRAALKQSKPDAILMDVRMPGMDGIRLCHDLRCASDTADIPIIIVSGYYDKGTVHDATLFGASDFLTKPFEMTTIKKKVEESIARAKAKRK